MVPLEYNTLMRSCHHCLKFSRMWGHSCCSFRTLVRAHRKRRSTAGHGGFYVIFASVRRVSRHHGVGWGGAVMTFLWTWSRCWCYATHWDGVGWGGAVMTFLWTWSRCWCYATHWGGVGWGSDDVPLDLITVLMLRHALGWGGVGQWWRSFGLDHVVDATPRIGVGWGSDDVPLDLITLLDSTIKSARKAFIYIYLYLFVSVNIYIYI